MNAKHLRLAAANWRAVHEAVHGSLTAAEAELVNEAMDFLITCAQVDESPQGSLANNTPDPLAAGAGR